MMSTLGVAILSGVVGLVLGGAIATFCVEWYRVSSFEGGSGYFVLGLALVGGIVGIIVGVVAARVVATSATPGFMRALVWSVGGLLAAGVAITVPARLLAHVAPKIDGDELLVAFELAWPAADTVDPRTRPGVGIATLGSVIGGVQRRSEAGPLLLEDTRRDDNRWVVPGAVGLFTERGERMLDVAIGEERLAGFVLPIPRRPGSALETWSEWMPRSRPGEAPLADGFRVRFRLVRTSAALRTQQAGAFTITTRVNYFLQLEPRGQEASSSFGVSHRGTPLPTLQQARYVGVIPGERPALVVHAGGEDDDGSCLLLVDEGERVREVPLGDCSAPVRPQPLATALSRDTSAKAIDGWVDYTTFAGTGLVRLGEVVVDTRTREAIPFELPTDPSPDPTPGLIAVSPDEQSVVWFATVDSGSVLGVTRIRGGASYTVPIDRARMRFAEAERLDAAWVDHHFTWVRTNGVDMLQARRDFTPLPYVGDLQIKEEGDYMGYYLKPGTAELRGAVFDLLLARLSATRAENSITPGEPHLTVDGQTVQVSWVESGDFVSVSMHQGNTALMRRIAQLVDAELRTGKLDSLFGR